MSVYREFLYLNAKLVDEFLAQVEGGIFDDEKEKGTRSGDGAAKVGVKVSPVEASYSRGTSASDEVERVRRQTPESRYNRLHASMSATEDLAVLDGSSGVLFKEIEPRSLVEIDCDVDVPQISRFLSSGSEIAGLFDMVKAFSPESIDAEAEQAFSGLSALGGLGGNAVVAVGEVESDAMKFAFKLDREWLRCDLGDLEGEATVVGRVLKKWSEGQSHSLLTLPGLSLMNREQRRQWEREQSDDDSSDEMFLKGPASTLSVVAIFR